MENFRKYSGIKRRVLIVDDEPVNCEILRNILQDRYDVTCAHDGRTAYDELRTSGRKFSLILLDLMMPGMDGFEFIELTRADREFRSIPIIVMTSEKSAEVRSIQLGAADFITKPYDMPEVIQARCDRIVELFEDKTIIRSAEKDPLTGLYSRDFFYEYIRQIEVYNSERVMDALIFNIDHFHLINEMYGRSVGDQVLKGLADVLTGIFDEIAGIGCRVEADNFYVYCQHQFSYMDIMNTIRDNLPELSKTAKIRVRMGVYPKVDKSIGVEQWFDRAKGACDRIRGDYTKSISEYSSDLYEKALYHENLINEIDEAITNGDLLVYYQPKYNITGEKPRLCSAEALVRWKHPERGMISPGDFIPLFEGNGLIQKLDNYVWEKVAYQIRKWKEKYGRTIPVSVNVSRIDIYDPELEKKLLELVRINDLSTADLMLEITESAYSDNAQALMDVVDGLRGKGFKIEMDDFGAGYSSLNMLAMLPIDVLKLDREFIMNVQKDEKSLKLVKLIIDIAQFLHLPVIAEGVEHEEEVAILKSLQCDVIQGFYFSQPVTPEEFETFIKEEIEC